MKGFWHFPALAVVVSSLMKWMNHPIIAAVFLVWLFYLFYRRRICAMPFVLSLISLIFFSFFIPRIETTEINHKQPPQDKELTGTIITPIQVEPEKISFIFQIANTDSKVSMLYFPDNPVHVASDYPHIAYGSTCRISTLLDIPKPATNPGQFDYQGYANKQGISYQSIITSLDELDCLEGTGFLHHIYQIRASMLDYVNGNISDGTAAWILALLFGDKSFLAKDTIELFRQWGLSHLLAISGLHVGLMITITYFLLVRTNLFTKEYAQWGMLLFLPVYALMAGGEPSVWRASIMAIFFIILHKTKWKISVTDVLSITFIVLILFDKLIIYHVGFQLSFMVTFGLLLSRKCLSRTKSSIKQMLLISFIAQMMIIPLLFHYFHILQPLSILLNLFIVPYFTFFVIPTLLMLLFTSPISTISSIIDQLFIVVHEQVLLGIGKIDNYLHYPLVAGSMSFVAVILYYLFLFFFMGYLERGKQVKSFYCGVIIVMIILVDISRPFFSPIGTVTMLDIGQGDAFIIELPYRKGVILIDAGSKVTNTNQQPSASVYNQVIQPYLFAKGIHKIDAIFLSHEDLDHIGSVDYILEDIEVNNIFISDFFDSKEIVWNYSEVVTVKRNDTIVVGNTLFKVLAPFEDRKSANDNSLVLFTNIGGMNWLFTGDISKKEEKEIVKSYPNINVDVLKVAHHGSKTSTDKEVLTQLAPHYALISVGEDNSYGHPSDEVIRNLRESGAIVLRTDRDGAIQFKFIKDRGTFYRFLP